MRSRLRTLLTQPQRWMRFSLRAVMLAVAAICVWLGIESSRARTQTAAIAEIQRLGGRLAYDFQMDRQGRWIDNPRPSAPDWLVRAIGDDYFRRVAVVNFDEGSDPTDSDLAVLKDVPQLRVLTLMNRQQVTDSGLHFLSHQKQLQKLSLDGTSVEGHGLAYLRSPDAIELLGISNSPFSDAGLKHIAQMSSLKVLIVRNTKITDNGLAYLASLPALESLQIDRTAVTDSGLRHLVNIKSLKKVLLDETQTTERGRADLRQALPGCKVE